MRPDVGTETRAGQHDIARQQEVALTLIGVPGMHGAQSVHTHPFGMCGGFAGAFGVGKPCDNGVAPQHDSAVGRVDHVR